MHEIVPVSIYADAQSVSMETGSSQGRDSLQALADSVSRGSILKRLHTSSPYGVTAALIVTQGMAA